MVVSLVLGGLVAAGPLVPGLSSDGSDAQATLSPEAQAILGLDPAEPVPGAGIDAGAIVPGDDADGPSSGTDASGPAASSGPAAGDRLFALVESGIVKGSLTANAAYKVEVVNGGAVKASATGKTKDDGSYSAGVPWHDGVGEGLHRGDTVRVTDQAAGRTYTQVIGLAGALEEHTGKFVAITLPNAQVTAVLYKVFAPGKVVAQKTVTADGAGRVVIDWSAVHNAGQQADRPPWRGYDVEVVARTTAGQAQHREFSTVSPTLANTLNQGGGGNFVPGDNVTFELMRNGVVRDKKSVVVNADGVPRVVFSADVGQGDMMRTRYHESSGIERFIDMAPWTLTADVDLAAKTISGMAAPNVPVGGVVRNPGNEVSAKTVAGADGRYVLKFAAMVADAQLSVWRVADAGNTGVAVQQQLMHTPIIRVDDVTAEVTGNGAHGVNNAVIDVVRSGTKVFSKTVTTTKAGKYRAQLKTEMVPGDSVHVTTGNKVLGPFPIGSTRFTTYGVSGGRIGGTGVPGRRVTAGRTGCLVTAIVGAGGTWGAVPAGCTLAATDHIITVEEETSGPAAGFTRGHFQWVTSPDVSLTAPASGSKTDGTVTFTADAHDHDDVANPTAVRFYVDGQLVGVDTAAPYSYSAVLPAGAHTVVVEAVDAGARRDSTGKEIVGRTAARHFRV